MPGSRPVFESSWFRPWSPVPTHSTPRRSRNRQLTTAPLKLAAPIRLRTKTLPLPRAWIQVVQSGDRGPHPERTVLVQQEAPGLVAAEAGGVVGLVPDVGEALRVAMPEVETAQGGDPEVALRVLLDVRHAAIHEAVGVLGSGRKTRNSWLSYRARPSDVPNQRNPRLSSKMRCTCSVGRPSSGVNRRKWRYSSAAGPERRFRPRADKEDCDTCQTRSSVATEPRPATSSRGRRAARLGSRDLRLTRRRATSRWSDRRIHEEAMRRRAGVRPTTPVPGSLMVGRSRSSASAVSDVDPPAASLLPLRLIPCPLPDAPGFRGAGRPRPERGRPPSSGRGYALRGPGSPGSPAAKAGARHRGAIVHLTRPAPTVYLRRHPEGPDAHRRLVRRGGRAVLRHDAVLGVVGQHAQADLEGVALPALLLGLRARSRPDLAPPGPDDREHGKRGARLRGRPAAGERGCDHVGLRRRRRLQPVEPADRGRDRRRRHGGGLPRGGRPRARHRRGRELPRPPRRQRGASLRRRGAGGGGDPRGRAGLLEDGRRQGRERQGPRALGPVRAAHGLLLPVRGRVDDHGLPQPAARSAHALLGDVRVHLRHPPLELPLELLLHVPARQRFPDDLRRVRHEGQPAAAPRRASWAASSGASA